MALIFGVLLLLGSAGVGLAGGALALADHAMRDDAGFLMSPTRASTPAPTRWSPTSLEIHTDLPNTRLPHSLLGRRQGHRGRDDPVFVGIARTADVEPTSAESRTPRW